jgi:hypothetical protein
MHPPHALRLEYNQKLELTGAFAEEQLTDKDIEAIRATLNRNFAETAGPGIGQVVLLATGPVEGWWCYRDRFQIIRVPLDAPRPNFLMAAHPFLLEFAFNQSPDFAVSGRRRQREGYRIALVLSSLLRRTVTWHQPREVGNRNHAWVELPSNDQARNVAYCHITYEHASIRYTPDAFTPTDGVAAIPLVPAEEYYRPGYFGTQDGLELPDDLRESFDFFFTMPAQEQERFLQASYWLIQTNRVDSFSAMLLYAIQAIESLSWRPRSQSFCQACGKPEGPGPTRLFNEFLDQFAAGAIGGQQVLYSVRSGLSHGSRPPFLIDTEMLFGFIPEEYEQMQLAWDALLAARIAVHNWLRNWKG